MFKNPFIFKKDKVRQFVTAYQKGKLRTSKVAQWVKALTSKPHLTTWVQSPGATGRRREPNSASCPLTFTYVRHCMCTRQHIQNKHSNIFLKGRKMLPGGLRYGGNHLRLWTVCGVPASCAVTGVQHPWFLRAVFTPNNTLVAPHSALNPKS